MKIAAKSVEGFLANPKPSRAVLLYGPDGGLVMERARKLKEVVLGKNPDPFAFVELEEAKLLADPALFVDEVLAVSMMAPKRVIMLRDAGEKIAAVIREAAAHFHDDVFLIVTAGELTPRSGLRAWFEGEAQMAALACYRDEMRDVAEVMRKRFAEAGVEVEREGMDYLMQQLGNDRGVTLQELEKLVVFAGEGKRLSLQDIQGLVDYNRETNLDDMVQAMADRDVRALDAMVQLHVREGTQPVAYIRALMRYFNRLYSIRAQMAAGQPMDMVIQNLKPKVFFKQEQSLRRHVQQWDSVRLAKALMLLVSAELACKTSDVPLVAASSRKLFQVTQIR